MIQKTALRFLLFLCLIFAIIRPTYAVTPTTTTGSITICQIILDLSQNPTSGSSLGAASFAVGDYTPDATLQYPVSPASFATQTFTLPLSLNTKILATSSGNDAECHTIANLPLGSYYYTNESSVTNATWDTPLFDDFSGIGNTPFDGFKAYDSRLFTDPTNSGSRSYQADGNIYLTSQSPNRMVSIMTQFNKAAPTPTEQPTPASISIAAPNQTNTPVNSTANLTSNPTPTPKVITQAKKVTITTSQKLALAKIMTATPSATQTVTPTVTPSLTDTPTYVPTSITPTETALPTPSTLVDSYQANQNAYLLLSIFLVPLLIFFFILFWYKRREREEETKG